MKEKYIKLMEKALSAYTDEHILRYFNDVKTNGLTEHGFPRLTANIGILIAHGRRRDLLPLFLEMMDFCCEQIPRCKAANDFSVREIICCIWELEAVPETVSVERISRWRALLATIEPENCYNSYAQSLKGTTRNWAIFMTVSELFRERAGLRGDATDFIDTHLSHQMKWFDENGMYEDNKYADGCHQPIMYDYSTRGLCCLLLCFGYKGKYREEIDGYLKNAALMSLRMQSPSGEIPFGGRSNQYLLCEGWQAQLFEFEANRYATEGDIKTAAAFKRAAVCSVEVCERWLSHSPISHIKNRFPTNSRYGCEAYGYFDKYMITTASNFYVAYLMCNEDIPVAEDAERSSYAFATSDYFHKFFIGNADHQLEFDLNADPHYDANGLGRIHREGAPSTICLSCPCPAEPGYTVDIETPFAFSMCSAIRGKDGWLFGAEKDTKYEVSGYKADKKSASATLLCRFADDQTVREHYTLDENGVSITAEGDGEIGYTLPAFCFDGEVSPEIAVGKHSLTVSYDGWVCRYTTNGVICDPGRIAANRNGHYRAFIATSQNTLNVKIEITKASQL